MTDSGKLGTIRHLIRAVGALSAAVLGTLVLLIVFDATRRYLFHEGSVALSYTFV